MLYKKRFKLALGTIILLIVAASAWSIYGSIKHRGLIGVEIQTVPGDAEVLLDGKLVSSTPYLKPGTYTFTASKDGFKNSSLDMNISASHHYVGITLTPISDAATKWAADNQAKYEKVGSRMIDERIVTVDKVNPLLSKLPYIDVMGPFSVNYAFSSEDSVNAYIVIKNATPAGRVKALQWIRDQGVDPADLNIQFEDFVNPTTQGDV